MIADRYELGQVIGTGGMSEVFVATDTLLGRQVAVKMLRADLARDVNFRERFRREAQNSGRLNHPNIVAVYDTGETEIAGLNTPYIVMELVHGRTLRDIIREDGPLTPAEAASTLIPVCHALQVSHEAGIIHRDIKPANVMITNTGAVKIMDFGIARALDDATSAMTQTSAVIGTAQYLSPEQARGKLADARSDVYALGCVMYETITAHPPFEGETPFAVAYQHVQEDPVKPSEYIRDLTPTAAVNVDAVVLTAMAKHPADRYQSAQEMAEDLERLERHAVTNAARSYVDPVDPPTQVAPVAAPTKVQQDPPPAPKHQAPAPVPAKKNKNSALKIIAALLAVAVLGIGGAFAYDYFSGGSSASKNMVMVPGLEGMSQQEAVEKLESLKLQVAVNEEPNPQIQRGEVIRSNPGAGSSVPPNSTVTLTVSSGKEITEVPDLRGKTTKEAERELKKAGLELDSTVREDASDEVKKGEVMEQSPSAGAQVSRGSKVTITVSTGKATERVPNITGLQWSQAESNLTALGFRPRVERVDSLEPEGTVIAVSSEGENLPADSEVVVQVSNGQLMVMPDIRMQSPQQAVNTLRQAGWTGDVTKLPEQGTVATPIITDRGKIAGSTPEAGEQVRKDATITIRTYEFDLGAITG
ncbi:Stk1 family PASTA domain-containing Ser/Thr kinase [Corynebacterium pelargi]|uniref:non-specific serine/threonine protein kinase n=1 Tax=Corynebacterium pelargi TaxID=1471400 RepID=A0A410W5V0_9CORY|nr:Stk1 family PASTA domain-containing Ser/Thr kinase [Corynebacterium pelargi]QAU51332.1 Serine/threonine-protein kinase PknB [Corynebacterium pelargi]GGG81689.1 putative serine/threonine-protein kinase PknB [Corynebacterium pelargi]